MLKLTAIVLGALALPNVLGAHVFWDGSNWHMVAEAIDPESIKRHIYDVSEFCPNKPREMWFGDEVIVESQRPWQSGYPTGITCKMNFTGHTPDVGLIVSLLNEETASCEDYLRITTIPGGDTSLYCGPRTNVTGDSDAYMNETVELEWTSIKRDSPQQEGRGFAILFTAYQTKCHVGQTCFPCTNGLVIDQVHMCNGLNNCGDMSDEIGCPVHYPPPSHDTSISWSVIILTLCMCIALIGMAVLSSVTFRLYRERESLRQTRAGDHRSLFTDEPPAAE